MQRLTNLEQQNHADIIKESVHVNVLNKVRNQLPKLLPKVVSDVLKTTLKIKAQEEPPYYERGDDVDEPRHDDDLVHDGHEVQTEEIPGKHNHVWFQKTTEELPIQSWFNELVDAEEEPEEHEKKRIPVNYFFNHDLEYLVKGSKERTYALFVTKIKATRYEDEGIEEMIPSLWSPNIQKYNRDAEIGICHWYPSRQLFYKGNIEFLSRHEVYSKQNIRSVPSIKVDSVMSSASSAVTYTSIYTDSEPERVFWGADEEISDG
ncbi:hypothetical protein Tco_1231053, partial [Tanacetum coccineum]